RPCYLERIACKTASTARPTLMPVMQRKSIGHVRRKQGAQGALDLSKRWEGSLGKPGPVNSGEVLPKGTTTGVPRAAATCIGVLAAQFIVQIGEQTLLSVCCLSRGDFQFRR